MNSSANLPEPKSNFHRLISRFFAAAEVDDGKQHWKIPPPIIFRNPRQLYPGSLGNHLLRTFFSAIANSQPHRAYCANAIILNHAE